MKEIDDDREQRSLRKDDNMFPPSGSEGSEEEGSGEEESSGEGDGSESARAEIIVPSVPCGSVWRLRLGG